MGKSVLYILGAVVVLGGGAFLFLKSKKSKDAIKLAEIEMKKALEETPLTKEVAETKTQFTEKPISADDLLAVAKLKDSIKADIRRMNSYKKASSRANVQREIDKQLETLKSYGFGLDTKNELIKIR